MVVTDASDDSVMMVVVSLVGGGAGGPPSTVHRDVQGSYLLVTHLFAQPHRHTIIHSSRGGVVQHLRTGVSWVGLLLNFHICLAAQFCFWFGLVWLATPARRKKRRNYWKS